jgi:Pyruvate/2-oxoacid:ferredoxin oxidoreductase delta subunit
MDRLSSINQRIAELEATGSKPPVPTKPSRTDSDGNRRFQKMTAVIDQERCMNCGLCVDLCQEQAINMNLNNYTVEIDSSKCSGCGSCVNDCPGEAISLSKTARSAL